MVIVRSKTILPAIFYEVNVMQYESISSMTVVSGYKYPTLLKEHLSFYHTVDTKIKMFIRWRPNWEVEAQIFCWADFHHPHDIHCSEWTRKFKANHFMIIELSNCPAVLASIALFQWDWNQNTLFFSHDSKGSVPFNSKTAHPWAYPGIWLEFLCTQWGNWPISEACLGGHLTFMSKCWSASQTKGFHNSFIQHVHCIHESLLLNSLFCWSIWEPLKKPVKVGFPELTILMK